MGSGMVRKSREVNLSVMRYHDVGLVELVQWEFVEVDSTNDTRAIALEMLAQYARLPACQQGLERAGGER